MKNFKIISSLVLASALNTLQGQNLQNGLQACYPLDCNANNYASTGGGLNGTTFNVTCATGVNGVANTAMEFSGATNSYIELPDDSRLKPSKISFSGWVRFDVNTTHQYIVFVKNTCSAYFEGYALAGSYTGGALRLQVAKSSAACSGLTQHVITGNTALSANTWYHVGFYAGNDSLKLFLNGAPEGSPIASSTSLNYDAGTEVYLGGTNSGIQNFPLDGRLDNIRFYNRKLTNAEFAQLYSQNPSCSATGAPYVLTDSLQACYPLDCNVTNYASTGSPLNGTPVNVTCTTDRFGNANSAYEFSGLSNSYIQLPNDSRIKANTNAISLSAWVRFDANNKSHYIAFAKNSCSAYFEGYSFAASYNGSNLRLQIAKSSNACSPGTQHVLNGTTNLSANTWYHVGFYAGTDSLKLFLNGNPEGTPIASTTNFDFAATNVFLGGTNQGVNAPLDGKLDEVRIYNRKLYNHEFLTLKNNQVACSAAGPGLLNGLQACYPLNCNAVNFAPTTSGVPPSLDGTLYNIQCDTGVTNVPNTACKFSGNTNSYIELPIDPRIKPAGTSPNGIMFAGWVKLDVLNSGQYIVFAKNTCSAWFEGYMLGANAVSGQIRYQIAKASSSSVGCGTQPVLNSNSLYSPYAWHHVAFYMDNSIMKLYVDGALDNSMSSNVVINYDNTNVYLGGTNSGIYNAPLNGTIDNVRFYNRELTSAEVGGLAGYVPDCDAIVWCGGNPTNCRGAAPTGIGKTKVSDGRIELYPNPSSDKFYINNVQDKTLMIYDINGKQVRHNMTQKDETTGEIDLLDNSAGIYFVRVIDNKGNTVQTSKIILAK